MSQIQVERCAARISDPDMRLRFEQDMHRADQLILEAAQLRRRAWADFRAATGELKREKVGQYA